MKKYALVLMLAVFAAAGFSQSAFTIGGNYWRASPDFEFDMYQDTDMGDGNMIGPYINYRFGKLIFGGSLFFGNFKLSREVDAEDYFDPYDYYDWYYWGDYYNQIDLESVKMEATLKRMDINGTIGYSVIRPVTVFAAFKSINSKLTDYKINGEDEEDIDDFEYSGILIGGGISGVAVFPQSPFFLFGSFAFLTGSLTYKEGGEEVDYGDAEDQNLASFTLGAGYRLTPRLNLLVGYRSDAMNAREADVDASEKYKGITISLGYTVR